MVHIKTIELSHFKSFGGTTTVPFLPGFTVVSGPNGSGKSNILDALLFCLGLASSKGMRAERLPDLVNHSHSKTKGTAETLVSVTFDLRDGFDRTALDSTEAENHPLKHLTEWTVSRRLRVSAGGGYTSTYYINGEVCTATELHQQLSHLRIYPEGYNVVLQGDVTRIITMNSKERRQIIDELAGVAQFDRKIEQTRATLEEVREREERFRLIEGELQRNLSKLEGDRQRAEQYKTLREKVHRQSQQAQIWRWRWLRQQEQDLQEAIARGIAEHQTLIAQIQEGIKAIHALEQQWEQLNRLVKTLGEEEQLRVAQDLAQLKAQLQQFHQRRQEYQQQHSQTDRAIQEAITNREQIQRQLHQDQEALTLWQENRLPTLRQQQEQIQTALQASRQEAELLAASSEAWVQEQTYLSRHGEELQQRLSPLRQEQAQLTERGDRLDQQIAQLTAQLTQYRQEWTDLGAGEETTLQTGETAIQDLAAQLASIEGERQIQQETQSRLHREQREKQRQWDRLEAKQQAQREAQGSHATQILQQANLAGICGLVAQLGSTDPAYQLALEIAAGGRLGFVVVEDDTVAVRAIEVLKRERGGRATFLPLNKIQAPSPRFDLPRYTRGLIDLAVNLVTCDDRYRDIFQYVFGNTLVFEDLATARPHLGKGRLVTLEGELLEPSGALTGGSAPGRGSLRLGTARHEETEEMQQLRHRLADLELLLAEGDRTLAQLTDQAHRLSQALTEARQQHREQQLHQQQRQSQGDRLRQQIQQGESQQQRDQEQRDRTRQRLTELAQDIPRLEQQWQQQQQRLRELEASQSHSEWQEMQRLIKSQEQQLQDRTQALQQGEQQARDLHLQQQRLRDRLQAQEQRLQEQQHLRDDLQEQLSILQSQETSLSTQIAETEARLTQISDRLASSKAQRDQAEGALKAAQQTQQERQWRREKLQIQQEEQQTAIAQLQEQLQTLESELPDPLPEVGDPPPDLDLTSALEQLDKAIRSGQKRLEAMEPVNMLALEEYKDTEGRLQELSEKLNTLAQERTDLLSRVEKFTTLRLKAFREAFDAVNINFQSIFATLSEGDGYLQLDNPSDPFSGGLNLVAHPKGKPVQRLSSMSGGEKSLTALSFIFSLQRYRPSPFYAFDEVDMFLDGANVERLSRMIQHQAQQAQFIVVSLRRPMIEAAQRTIGVTQARGAHTQVLGIRLA